MMKPTITASTRMSIGLDQRSEFLRRQLDLLLVGLADLLHHRVQFAGLFADGDHVAQQWEGTRRRP